MKFVYSNTTKFLQNMLESMKNLLVVLLMLCFFSCETRKSVDFQDVNESNQGINGIFENSEMNILHLLDRKLLKDTLNYTNINSFKKFSIRTNKTIKISLTSDDGSIINREYKYKKANNLYYLKNKNVKPLLIPFLAGAIDEKSLCLYVNKENNLVIDVYEARSGAILFVGFLDWKSKQKKYNYKRIE